MWGPDLSSKCLVDRELLLTLSESQLKSFFNGMKGDDTHTVHYLLHTKEPAQHVDIDATFRAERSAPNMWIPLTKLVGFLFYTICVGMFQALSSKTALLLVTIHYSRAIFLYGKSRLLLEASRSISILYVCMRTTKSGFPRQTQRKRWRLSSQN
jgi:hypothetical protein